MITPTQEKMASGSEEYAGLNGLVLLEVQRCSMGEAAGMRSR